LKTDRASLIIALQGKGHRKRNPLRTAAIRKDHGLEAG